MERLETLIFELNEKTRELDELRTDIFVFNPRINELVSEIEVLREEIDKIKSEENNG